MKTRSIRSFVAICLFAAGATGLTLACSDDETSSSNPPRPDSGPDVISLQPDTGPTTCPPQPAPTCTAEKCTADKGGEPHVCVNNACVKMKSADCPKVGGDLKGANVVVIGAALAQNGANQTAGVARINSLELAIEEVNASGGIPDPDKCKPPRTLAYVACDDANIVGDGGNTIDRIRGAKHLIDDLKVPAIVGASTSGNTLDVAKNAAIPGKVMQFAPSSTAISITAPTDFNASPDGTRLLWRAAPSDVVQSIVLRQIFLQVETQVKSGGVASPKLALITKNDAYGTGIAQAFKNGLQVNGAAPTAASFQEYVYKTAAADPTGMLRADVATALETFKPEIIVMAGTSEATDDIMRVYESKGLTPKPIYVLADGQKKAELTALIDPADPKTPAPADRAGLRTRIRGTQPGVITALASSFFNVNYKSKYGADSVLSYGMAGTYDIGYLLAYAVAATKGGPVDGTTLAKNMGQLVGGTEVIDVGKSSLSKGFAAMRSGTKVDFNGASGPLDFDLATGEAPSDYSIWCVKLDPNTSKPIFEEAAGLSYSAKEAKLVGTFTCP